MSTAGCDLGFVEFLSDIDAVVMGRVTFETVLGFDGEWPYAKPVFVLSTSLTAVPEHLAGEVSLSQGSPAQVVADLERRGFSRLYIDDGKTIQGFLEADRIDGLIVSRLPTLLGGGVPLFDALPSRLDFEHVETEVLMGCIVKSRYRRRR